MGWLWLLVIIVLGALLRVAWWFRYDMGREDGYRAGWTDCSNAAAKATRREERR